MNERTLTKTQFLVEGDPNNPVIRTFRRKKETALFNADGKFVCLMDWKEYNALPDRERKAHSVHTVWTLIPAEKA